MVERAETERPFGVTGGAAALQLKEKQRLQGNTARVFAKTENIMYFENGVYLKTKGHILI